MSNEYKLELKILSIVVDKNTVFARVNLVFGDLLGIGESTSLTCVETGGRWEYKGRALLSDTERENNTRLIMIKHVDGSNNIHESLTLVAT